MWCQSSTHSEFTGMKALNNRGAVESQLGNGILSLAIIRTFFGLNMKIIKVHDEPKYQNAYFCFLPAIDATILLFELRLQQLPLDPHLTVLMVVLVSLTTRTHVRATHEPLTLKRRTL